MKYIICMLIFMAGLNCFGGYQEKVSYWYYNNVSTNLPAVYKIASVTDDNPARLLWHIDNPPSKATIDAINDATAIAWFKDYNDIEAANYDKWSKREKAMFKLIIKEINKLRVKDGDPAYTGDQIKSALKAGME